MRRLLAIAVLGLSLSVAGWAGYWLFFTPAGALWTVERVPGLKVTTLRGSLAGPLALRGLRWRAGSKWLAIDHLDLDWSPAALLRGQVLVKTLRMSGVDIHLVSSPKPTSVPDLSLPPLPLWSRILRVRIGHLDLAQLTWWKGQQKQLELRHFSGDLAWSGGYLRSGHFRLALSEGEMEGSLDLGWTARSLQSSGTWTMRGTRTAWSIDWKHGRAGVIMGGPVAFRVEGSMPMTVTADLLLERHALRLRNARVAMPRLGQPALVDAVLSVGPASRPYRLGLHVKEFCLPNWPKPVPAGPYAVDLQLEGSPQAYRGSLEFRASKAHWRLAGLLAGNKAGVRLTALSGTLLGGRSTGGWLELAWRPRLRIAASLALTGVSPQVLLPNMRGDLNGTLGLLLAKEVGGLGGHLTLDLGPSRIYRQNLQGHVQLSFAPRVFRVDALDLRGPGLSLSAAGALGRRVAFTARVSRWADIFPKLQGESRVSGWVAYASGHWLGQIEGAGRGLGFDAYRAASLHLAAASEADGRARLNLKARGVRIASEKISLDVRAQGALAAFDSRIEVRWRDDTARLAAKVSRDAGAWNVALQHLGITGQHVGRWGLTAPARIGWHRGRITVSTVSLADGQGASLRMEGHWNFSDQKGQGSLRVSALPLDLVDASGAVQLRGRADLDLAARCTALCTADGDASLWGAMFTWRQPDRATIQVPISSWTMRLNAAPKAFGVVSRLSLAKGFGAARATVTLPITLGVPFQWPPTGPVQGKFLLNIGHYMPAATQLHGVTAGLGWQLGANLQLAGTWEHPAWSGSADLKDAAVYVPQAGISVTGISAQFRAQGNHVTISQFHANSGAGSIGGQGAVTLSGFAPSHYRMQVTGKDFSVLNLPEVTAAVAPNILIEGDRRRISITGDVAADQLRILGSQIGGVRPSRDVVFAKAPAESGRGPALNVSLRVALGDDAKVIMGGLQSGLQGELRVGVKDGQPPQLEGTLHMVNGSYQIYGKNLKFSRGVIRFHGPPNLAALDVLALRHIAPTGLAMSQESVQAGVQVTGTLQSPQVQLYSVPAMSDTDVLSYLLFGYPASGLQSQNTLLAAAASQIFSATQATLFRQRLLGGAGLANIGVESTGTPGLTGTMITLGRYLTPDLYVSIGQSIFGAGTVARLRYRLSRSIELQTEGGTVGSGVNLYYRIDLP